MSEILRVVIDTSHIMSAILSSRGAFSKLIDRTYKGGRLFHAVDIGTDPKRMQNFSFCL